MVIEIWKPPDDQGVGDYESSLKKGGSVNVTNTNKINNIFTNVLSKLRSFPKMTFYQRKVNIRFCILTALLFIPSSSTGRTAKTDIIEIMVFLI